MVTTRFLSAIAAIGITAVSAQGGQCSEPTITVANAAEATINCRTVSGSIVFDDGDGVAGNVIISGPQSIDGDLIIRNASKILSLTSTTINRIGGKFELATLELVSNVQFSALQTVGEISWVGLPQLETLNFGTDGVTTVTKVEISNTFLASLDGLNLASVDTFNINNNGRLSQWESQLGNISTQLTISDNNGELEVIFADLKWAKNMEIRGLKSLSVPALSFVNGSLEFSENDAMTSFIAPNLTETGESLSFRNNAALSNVSIPLLTRVGGGLTIQNNQELVTIDGFPLLEKVGGAITIRGNFTEAELPKLGDVKGVFDVSSTENIDASCTEFKKYAPRKQGGNGVVQGKFDCVSNDQNANTGGNADKDDDKDGAGLLAVNMPAILGLALVAGIVQLA